MRVSSLFLILFLISCSRPNNELQTDAATSATFTVDLVEGSGEDAKTDATFSNKLTARLVNFTACFKDVAVQEAIVGANFEIHSTAGTITPNSPATDSKGCIYWSETLSTEGTSFSRYQKVERRFVATSGHKGSVTISLAVNPWKKGGEAVRDLRFQSAPIQSSGQASTVEEKEGVLLVEKLNVEMEILRASKKGADASVRIIFEPKARRTDADGSTIILPITAGKFRVKWQFFASHPSGKEVAVSEPQLDDSVGAQAGVFMAKGLQKLLRKIPREANLEVLVKIEPLHAPAEMKPVVGKVSLGKLTSLNINRSGPLLLGKAQEIESSVEPTEEDQNYGFDLGKVKIAEVVVKDLDSTGRPKLLEFQYQACLRNSVTWEKIVQMPFVIKQQNKEFRVITDNEEGCLRWKSDWEFDYHSPEKLTTVKIEISSANEFYGEQSAIREISLNPWKYEETSRLVIDHKIDGEPSPDDLVNSKRSEILTPSVFFNFMGRSFSIDDQLNLSTIRKYRFETQPRIRRWSRNQGWLAPIGTGNGRYKMHLVLETIDDFNPTLIDTKTMEVESKGDIITTTVDFKIDDIRLVNARTNLYIKIEPIDKKSQLYGVTNLGTFDMAGGFAVRMEPFTGSVDDKIRFNQMRTTFPKSSIDLFTQGKGYLKITEEQSKKLGISDSELSKLFVKDTQSLKKLCALFFDPKGWYFSSFRYCESKPEDYIAVAKTKHSRKVVNSKLARLPETSTLSISHSLSLARYESEDESKTRNQTYSIDSGVKISAPIVKALGLEVGVGFGVSDSWGTSLSYNKGKSKGNSRSFDLGKQIIVDEAEFQISAQVDECLLVANLYDAKDTKKYYLCSTHPKPHVFKETYFLLYQPTFAGPIIDSGANVNDRPFLSLVRGEERYQSFVKVLQDPEVTLNFERKPPVIEGAMRESERRFDGYFPGLLTEIE